MKFILPCMALVASALADDTSAFIEHAAEKHGEFGKRAAEFLVSNMPEQDKKKLSAEFLIENLDWAMKARASFPWAKELPEEVFLNDVLPYAVFDEPRDPWRKEFYEMAAPIVKDAETAAEAAQLLNRDFFNKINVHYNTERKRTNQSPKESIAQGKATCTGLSIILVDACRAVGIPARGVGTPMWTNMRGNHTWVEIYADGEWHFTGADEYTDKGLNHAWFTADAAKADASKPEHAIYATTWKRGDLHFPLPWSAGNKSVAAVDVTSRYAKEAAQDNQVGVRLFDNRSSQKRIIAEGALLGEKMMPIHQFDTKGDSADLNDMPRVKVEPGKTYHIGIEHDDTKYFSAPFAAEAGETTVDLFLNELLPADALSQENKIEGLSKAQADTATKILYRKVLTNEAEARQKELEEKSITMGEHTMKWLEKTFGEEPEDGRSLWISMHGGGGAPARVNDQQWRNQIKLYQPKEGIYLAPRAPTNTWNLWHQEHIDPLFSRLIENMVAYRGVNPDKVYLMGYSAGGDGVWQLAPRMADRFAAASMMAGHPNESKLLGIRNLPFGIFMGGADSAYDRNKVAAEKIEKIKQLHEDDPNGYVHLARIYEGLPHWMDLKDAESVPWMAKFKRSAWPEKIVWYQDDVTHDRFYWLELPEGAAEKDQLIKASVDGQEITVEGDVPKGMRILLNDAFIDLDKPIKVTVNKGETKTFNPKRSIKVIESSLKKRLDPGATPTAVIVLD